MRALILCALAVLCSGCQSKTSKPGPPQRVELVRLTGTTFNLIPQEDQLPYCLAFTVSQAGPTRQLTMDDSNMSFECPPLEPIGGRPFKVPVSDGPVKVYVLFTSEQIDAHSVSQDLVDAKDRFKWSAMDLRIPGTAHLATLDFTPEKTVEPQSGQALTGDAGQAVEQAAVSDLDAGS